MVKFGQLVDAGQPIEANLFAGLDSQERRIAIVTGVNGSGKTTTTRELVTNSSLITLMMRHTTKELRISDYIYRHVSEAEFQAILEAGKFIEASHYGPGYYGTSTDETMTALTQGALAVCEMDPRASLMYKRRLQIGNIAVRLYFLDPFEPDTLPEDRMRIIQARIGNERDQSEEEAERLRKIVTFSYDDEHFDRRINTTDQSPDEIARIIYNDLVS